MKEQNEPQTDRITQGNKFEKPAPIRPILSSADTYDQHIQMEEYTEAFGVGRRPLWNVPQNSIANEKVTTIRASAAVQSAAPSFATQSGILNSPATTLTTFSVVPNMASTIKASGPIQVSFSVNAQTLNANDPGTFAIFRDGVQISQRYQGSAGAANTTFSVGTSFTDNPPLGYHVYDVRWKQGASKLTAVGTQRTIQVLNLRAQ